MPNDQYFPRRVLAEFDDPELMLAAIARLRDGGYRTLETYTPFDMPRTTEALGLRRSRLPLVVFLGGLFGALIAYWIQWFANTFNYPINVGGRPIHPVPAFIPATFEGTVLFASFAGFFGLWAALRLPKLWHPVFEVEGFERATIDRFWLEVGEFQSEFDAANGGRILTEAGALRVVPLERER
jgi:hypothetical protein